MGAYNFPKLEHTTMLRCNAKGFTGQHHKHTKNNNKVIISIKKGQCRNTNPTNSP